jgi:glucan phosphoethanolaminetransferase (alkaline phosphatase superfamily)
VRLVARFLCLLGAALLAVSALFDWLSVDSSAPRAFPLRDLLYGVSGHTAGFHASLAVPLLAALVLAVLAAVFGVRLLSVLAFAVAFATTGLWTTWEAISHSKHGTSFGPGSWRTGYWAVLFALLLLLVAMALPWRRRRATPDDDSDESESDTEPLPTA